MPGAPIIRCIAPQSLAALRSTKAETVAIFATKHAEACRIQDIMHDEQNFG